MKVPLVSILSMIWLWRDTADPERIAEPWLGRYMVWESSGTTGQPGIFVQDAQAMAVYDALEALRRSVPRPLAHWMDPLHLSERHAFVGVTGGHFASHVTLRRLRSLNQVPVALEEIWFAADGCPDLTAQALGDSRYLFYQQRLGVWIARVEDQISAAPAPGWATLPLGLLPGDCSGYIERVSWTASNQLAEFSKTWFDPAVCRYSSRLSQ